MAGDQKCYGSTEHTEDTEFFIHGGQDFFSSYARNLWGKSLIKNGRGQKRITMLLDFGSCFARCFGAARAEGKHAFTMPSRDKTNHR